MEYVSIPLIVIVAAFLVYLKMKKVNQVNAWLDAKGIDLNHNYSNLLGLDAKSGRGFVYIDAAYLFVCANEIEKRSLSRITAVKKRSFYERKVGV